MVFTEQQLQVKKLVDVQQDIEIDALNDGVGALSSTMQNGFTEAANNFYDIQNSLESMNTLSNERYNGLTGSVNALSNAMTQGFLDMGNTIVNTVETIQGQFNDVNNTIVNTNMGIQNQFNDVNNYVGGFENNVDTALQGIQNNFYGMENDYLDRFNQVNANISDSINNFNEQITNELSVNVFSADTMIYNVSATPVSSLTALGYDSNGKIIPVTVIANTNIQLPTSANYLYTDAAGTPYAGMADTAVSTNENLVTSHAVYNAVNDIWTDLNEFHNEVNNSFGDVHNAFNMVDDTLAGVQNQFNNVNNAHNTLYQNVVDGFIDVWANFDSVNNNISNMNNNIQNQFNGVNSNINGMNAGIQSQFEDIKNSMTDLLIMTSYPVDYYNSSSPIDYHTVEHIVYGTVSASANAVGNAKIEFDSTTKTLKIKPVLDVPKYCFNTNMTMVFAICTKLNQNIQIPYGVTNMVSTFKGCHNLNQNILIPSSVISMFDTFDSCNNLNQNILIPSSVKILSQTFRLCNNLNQNILIPSSVEYMFKTFEGCNSLNQNIYLYSDNIQNMSVAFHNCNLLSDKYIHIRSSIPLDTSNDIYNALVNNYTHVNWTGRVVNDLPAPTTWPPAN